MLNESLFPYNELCVLPLSGLDLNLDLLTYFFVCRFSMDIFTSIYNFACRFIIKPYSTLTLTYCLTVFKLYL